MSFSFPIVKTDVVVFTRKGRVRDIAVLYHVESKSIASEHLLQLFSLHPLQHPHLSCTAWSWKMGYTFAMGTFGSVTLGHTTDLPDDYRLGNPMGRQ